MQTSSSSLQSTPSKHRTSRAHTPSSPPSSRPQSKLIELIGAEIDDQTYEFDPDVVARMLSPKLPHMNAGSNLHPTLDNFECLIDQPTVQAAIGRLPKLEYADWDSTSETKNYGPMAAFLTKCVQKCDVVYDVIHKRMPRDSRFKVAVRSERWFPELCFIKYDKQTKDGTQNSNPLKPDIVAVDDSKAITYNTKDVACWWSVPPADIEQKEKDAAPYRYQILIAMEMKDSWPEMVKQSGTYARSMFAVSPLRSFVLVIAANHKKQDLRFLIFHHGGISATKALKLDNTGCHAVQKILLSILLWQCAEDAGLPTFTDGQSFHLPKDISINNAWNIRQHIRHALSTRGRNTYVASLESTKSGAAQTMRVVSKERRYPTRIMYPRMTIPALHSTQASSSRLQPTTGTGKHSSNTRKTSPLSGSPQAQETVTDSIKRSADEAKLDPISHREKKPRHLVAVVQPSSIIPPKLDKSTPSILVVKCSWPNVNKEKLEPEMYAACTNAFGTPRSLGSFVPCFRDNYPMCNSIFLPRNEDIKKHHWSIFSSGERPTPSPKEVDCRKLWITVLADEGHTLDECLNAQDLRECLLHSMIGWLSVYQRGYLHRDISIGNLLKLVNPVSRERFNALEFIRLVASPDEQRELDKLDLNDEIVASRFINDKHPECQDLLAVARELNNTLTRCGLTNECKAIVIDGDMAAFMPNYFDSAHDNGAFSGTVEFMSPQILEAIEDDESFLRSPLDDLWSFFWTALWATLYNCHHPGQTKKEKNWRGRLCDGKSIRDGVATSIRNDLDIEEEEKYSLILRQMAPLLRQWYNSLNNRTPGWAHELKRKRKSEATKSNEILMLYHKFAYTGVLDFVSIFSEHNIPVSVSA